MTSPHWRHAFSKLPPTEKAPIYFKTGWQIIHFSLPCPISNSPTSLHVRTRTTLWHELLPNDKRNKNKRYSTIPNRIKAITRTDKNTNGNVCYIEVHVSLKRGCTGVFEDETQMRRKVKPIRTCLPIISIIPHYLNTWLYFFHGDNRSTPL